MGNIYLIRAGESIYRTPDRDRMLSEHAKDKLSFFAKNELLDYPVPKYIFCSNTVRAIESAKCLWSNSQIIEVPEMYEPIEQNIFEEVDKFLQKESLDSIKSIWAKVDKKNELEEAITSVWEFCYSSAQKIVAGSILVDTIAVVTHDVIVNLVGSLLVDSRVREKKILHTRLGNGEMFYLTVDGCKILNQKKEKKLIPS